MNTDATTTITTLREELFATLKGIKNGTVDIDKARAVNDVAKTIIDSAKVEVDFMRVAGGSGSGFIDSETVKPTLPPGITGVIQHRLLG